MNAGVSGGVAAGQIRSIIERVERLEEEKAALAGDIREVYAEAKSNGYDCTVLRQIVAKRKKDKAELQEKEAILDLYEHALGMADEPRETTTKAEQLAGSPPPAPGVD